MGEKKDNLFIKILQHGWENFKLKHPSYATEYYDSIIEKTVHCRDPKFGYIEYRCMNCGQGIHRCGFSCKTKFCIHCARKSSNDFIEEIMVKLHPGVVYRHLILTIPEQLRILFYRNRTSGDLYSQFMASAKNYIDDVFRSVTGINNLKAGCVVVLHTAGRSGSYNPHLHVIVMAGGIDPFSEKWIDLPYFKYENFLPKKWQYHLLQMVKDFDSSDESIALVKKLWKLYPKGFVNNFKKGDVPKKIKHLVNYLAKYVSKPSISIGAIKSCDFEKDEVVYEYKDHRTKKRVVTSCDVNTFIGRMAQQILPKKLHRIRYWGIQHPSSYQKNRQEINVGLRKIGRTLNSDDSFIAYATGNWKWSKDPRKCDYCGSDLEVWKIWSEKYGTIYDAVFDLMKNGVSPPSEAIIPVLKITKVSEVLNFREQQLCFVL